MWETIDMEDAEVAVFAYGATARSAARAVRIAREQGIKVGLLRPITFGLSQINSNRICLFAEGLSCCRDEYGPVGE